jgi:hypothetical protein
LNDLSSESQIDKKNGLSPSQQTLDPYRKSSETSSKRKSSIYDKNRFRTIFLKQLAEGENGSFKRKGFQASEIYYAMTGEVPVVHHYKQAYIGGVWDVDLDDPVYWIDTLDTLQQEFILDGLRDKWEKRLENLRLLEIQERREQDQLYQNFMAYLQQKETNQLKLNA